MQVVHCVCVCVCVRVQSHPVALYLVYSQLKERCATWQPPLKTSRSDGAKSFFLVSFHLVQTDVFDGCDDALQIKNTNSRHCCRQPQCFMSNFVTVTSEELCFLSTCVQQQTTLVPFSQSLKNKINKHIHALFAQAQSDVV